MAAPDVTADDYFPVSADTMTRAQFYDCKKCRAIVLDTGKHDEWHAFVGMTEQRVTLHLGPEGDWRHVR